MLALPALNGVEGSPPGRAKGVGTKDLNVTFLLGAVSPRVSTILAAKPVTAGPWHDDVGELLLLGVLALEALDAAGGIHQFLLAGEKRMAVRADFDADELALEGGTRLEGVAAGAMHGDFVVVGMNARFHFDSSVSLETRRGRTQPRPRASQNPQ